MTDRPFPPSPRRRALARQAGLTAASPMLVGALACAAVAAVIVAGSKAAAMLGDAVAAACDGRAAIAPRDLVTVILAIGAPILGIAAIAAVAAHLAQTRSAWLPRRRIHGAPTMDRGPAARARRTAFELAAALAIGGAAFGWLWLAAPHVATLVELPAMPGGDVPSQLAGAGALIASALATLAIVWLAIGVFDALLRSLELARALRMSHADKREDDRLAGADPRWRAHRSELARGPSTPDAVAVAAVLLLGDDVAVAVAWDPERRPIPACVASGRRARATQLLGLARRHRVAVHRDAELAASLAGIEGAVPDHAWARLAEIIAAVRR